MSNSEQKVVATNGGIGLCGIMFIILFLLKVGVVETVVMGWSWWWITAPIWGPFALVVAFLLGCLLVGLLVGAIGYLVTWIIKRRKEKARIRRIAEEREAREAAAARQRAQEG